MSYALLLLLRDVPCADCGVRDLPELMEFDHVRGVKRANLADLARCSEVVIRAEAAKCDVVCGRCHKLRTLERRLDAHVAFSEQLDAELDDVT